MKKILEEILQELRQAKIDSLGTYRGGDYRIGLTKAEDIVNDKLHMHIVSRSTKSDKQKLSIKCLHCGKTFIKKQPHYCNNGFRKKNNSWQELKED